MTFSTTVQIKTHGDIARSLDCLFVPDLQKSKISLGLLGKHCLKYVGEGDLVKFFKGALVTRFLLSKWV